MMDAEKDENKRKREEGKNQSGDQKEENKSNRIEDEAKKCANILPGLTSDVDRGYEYVKTLKNDHLKEIIRFYFFYSQAGLGNKDILLRKLDHMMEIFDNVNAEMFSNEGDGDVQDIKIQIHIYNSFIWLHVT